MFVFVFFGSPHFKPSDFTQALEQQLKQHQDLLNEQDSQLVSMTEALGQTEASLQASQHELEQKTTGME